MVAGSTLTHSRTRFPGPLNRWEPLLAPAGESDGITRPWGTRTPDGPMGRRPSEAFGPGGEDGN